MSCKIVRRSRRPQLQLGVALARVKRYPEAIVALRKSLELQSDSVPAQYELGLALYEDGRLAGVSALF